MDRKKLHKKNSAGSNIKRSSRLALQDLRNQKRNERGMERRGISNFIEEEESDLGLNEGVQVLPVKKNKPDRKELLEAFRKKKQERKKEEDKSKKPPWRSGIPKNFDFCFKMEVPTKKKTLDTTSLVKPTKEKKDINTTGLAKPDIPAPVPQEIVTEEFNQLSVNDNTFDKDEPDQDDQISQKIILTPTHQVPTEDTVFKTPTILFTKIPRSPEVQPETENITTLHVMPMLQRGTNSDKRRQKKGKTPLKIPADILGLADLDSINDDEVVEVKDVNYFKKILEGTTQDLTEKCQLWETKKENLSNSIRNYEDVCGTIRLTIGKANLLMNKKGRFEQFKSLINNCEFGLGEKETTCMDLQGFWDMVFFQVEDVNLKFVELEELEAKNWITDEKSKTKIAVVKKPKNVSKPFKPKAKASSNLRALLAAKRKAVNKIDKENDDPQIVVSNDSPQIIISNDNDTQIEKKEEEVKFQAGFFELASPAKTGLAKPDQTLSAKRKSDANALRKSILNKRVSMSCGTSPWKIINVSNSIRRSISRENTPLPDLDMDNAKVIDKKPPRPSINLISFESPLKSKSTPRRSSRIASSGSRLNYNETNLMKIGASPNLKK